MNDCFDNWTIQLHKVFWRLVSRCSRRERYGYDLVKSLVEVPARVTEGTVYPLLSMQARLDRRPVGGVQRRPRPQILHFNPEG